MAVQFERRARKEEEVQAVTSMADPTEKKIHPVKLSMDLTKIQFVCECRVEMEKTAVTY